MVRQTRAQREWRPGTVKPPRSVKILFASSVLCLEALLMFFFGLMSWGLYQNEWFAWWLFAGSLIVAVCLVLTCALLRRPVGYWIGWGLQFVIIAGAVFEPLMLAVGVAFLACWWYALVKGRQLDQEKLQRFRAEEEYDRRLEGADPEDANHRSGTPESGDDNEERTP